MTQQIIDVGLAPGDGEGENGYSAFTKVNANFTEVYGNIGTRVTLPSIAAPALPVSGGVLYVDSNGALHFQSQWYDSTLPGAKFGGDATRPWFTTPIGFGNTVTGAGNNRPNIRIQRGNTSALPGAALSLLDTIGTNVTAQETAVIFQVNCSAGIAYDGIPAVGMQVEVDRLAGQYGTPFAANFVAKDLTGGNQAQVGTETDVVTSNPDTALVRVICDVIGREGVAQTLGLTTVGYGLRVRPSDNQGVTTGPVKILSAYHAHTETSYPGASIGDCFVSDGGATNGVSLSSKVINTVTLAAGVSGTPTLTFDTSVLAAASPGAWISDGAEAFIPAGTTILSVSTVAGVTTITMSANQTGNVSLGRAITITQAFDTGILLNGKFNVAARSVTTQYGLEETLQSGMVLGAPTGGAKGVGTLNATALYVGGVGINTPTTVGALPAAAAGNKGYRAFVTDATATTFASVVAGAGANNVPIYSDGTNWRIG